jgi:hypothetical protein
VAKVFTHRSKPQYQITALQFGTAADVSEKLAVSVCSVLEVEKPGPTATLVLLYQTTRRHALQRHNSTCLTKQSLNQPYEYQYHGHFDFYSSTVCAGIRLME